MHKEYSVLITSKPLKHYNAPAHKGVLTMAKITELPDSALSEYHLIPCLGKDFDAKLFSSDEVGVL